MSKVVKMSFLRRNTIAVTRPRIIDAAFATFHCFSATFCYFLLLFWHFWQNVIAGNIAESKRCTCSHVQLLRTRAGYDLNLGLFCS